MRRLLFLFGTALCLAATACGGSDDSQAVSAKEPIPGGGVSGPAPSGHADVFVINEDAAPLANATIYVGEGTAAVNVGATDSDGYLSASDPGLVSGSVVTASVSGVASVSYAGVTGSLVTFVFANPTPTNTGVNGTIVGWDDLPDPAPGKYRVARAFASHPTDLPTLDGVEATPGANSCVRRSGQPAECSIVLQVDPRSELLFAVIAEGDDSGTPDDFSDDALEATSLALGNGPGNGGSPNAAVLDILSASDIAHASVKPGNASGLVQVIGVPGVGLNGQVAIFPTFDSELPSYPVPRALGALASSKLWAIAAGASSNDLVHSVVLARDIEAPSGAEPFSTTLDDFLSPPTITETAGRYDITRAPTGVHAIWFRGVVPLEAWLLDERTSFTPPVDIDVTSTIAEVSVNEVSGELHPGTVANDLSRRSRQRF